MTLVRVIASLSTGWWRVIVDPGASMLDGGSHQDWPEEYVPPQHEGPNAEFWIAGFANGKPLPAEPTT